MDSKGRADAKATSMTLSVSEAFAVFMARAEPWGCRAVAMSNPDEAFKDVDGRLPALWLSSRQRFPGLAASLLARLPAARREEALRDCSRRMAAKALSSIHVCMEFQSRAPELGESRRLRKEARLAKELSKLIAAACADGFPVLAARRAALDGIAGGVGDFQRLNPACARWVVLLRWEDVADKALARAEARLLLSEQEGCGTDARSGPLPVPRL